MGSIVSLRLKRSPKWTPRCEICGSMAHRWDQGHTTCHECGDVLDVLGTRDGVILVSGCRTCARAARIREQAEAIVLAATLATEPGPSIVESAEPPALIDAKEAARLLGLSVAALYQRVSRHMIPGIVRTGRRVQFHRAKLLEGVERKVMRR